MSDDAPAVRRPVLDLVTGEVLDLTTDPTTDIAEMRDRLGDYKRAIDATLGDIDRELTERLDRDNVRSARVGDWHLETEAPGVSVWDGGQLGIVLEALVQQEKITREAAERALETVVEHKPKAVELRKLLEHADPDVRAAVADCRTIGPRARRRVTVKRATPAQGRLRAPQTPPGGTE